MEPELGATVAEHLRSCLGCARALRAHQQALSAFRTLRELESAPGNGNAAGQSPAGGGGSVLWERLRVQMHEAPASPLLPKSRSRRLLDVGARLPAGWRIALAAALLGASLLALGLKLASHLEGDAGGLRPASSLQQVRSEVHDLFDAGVLDPARSGAPRTPEIDRAPRGSQTHFVGRSGPNSNY